MILTVNIGNTHITIGGYEKDCLKFCGRLHSDIACHRQMNTPSGW